MNHELHASDLQDISIIYKSVDHGKCGGLVIVSFYDQ